MSVINRGSDEVKKLEQQLTGAPTFGAWLSILSQRHVLRQQLAGDLSEMGRLAQGWAYMPPPALRKT